MTSRSSERFGKQICKLRRRADIREWDKPSEVLLTNEMTIYFDVFRSFMKIRFLAICIEAELSEWRGTGKRIRTLRSSNKRTNQVSSTTTLLVDLYSPSAELSEIDTCFFLFPRSKGHIEPTYRFLWIRTGSPIERSWKNSHKNPKTWIFE